MDMGPTGKYQFIRHGSLIGAMMPNSAPWARPLELLFPRRNIDTARPPSKQAAARSPKGRTRYRAGILDELRRPAGRGIRLVGARR